MSLTLENVHRIAHLARIEVIPDEAETLRTRMNDILTFVEQLQTVESADITPMAHAVDVVQRLREDRVTEIDRHADFQAIAPETEDQLYLVPKVIE